MAITRSERVKKLIKEVRHRKKTVARKRIEFEREEFKLVLEHGELKEGERKLHLRQQHLICRRLHHRRQLLKQHQQQVQRLFANGLRLQQLRQQQKVLEKQQDVLKQQQEFLEAANKGVADMDVEEDGWLYSGIPLLVEAKEIWEWVCSMLNNKSRKSSKSILVGYHKEYLGSRDDRKDVWKFAANVQWLLGERIVLPMTDLRP